MAVHQAEAVRNGPGEVGNWSVMSVMRQVARPMLAWIFIQFGFNHLRDPSAAAPAAEAVVTPLAEYLPGFPKDHEQAVRLNGAVQVGAGAMLAMGRMPRAAALALAASLVPTTVAGHAFWKIEDPQERNQQLVHFLKNLSMLGGLLLAAADTGGRPCLARRSRAATAHARRDVRLACRSAQAANTARGVKERLPGR